MSYGKLTGILQMLALDGDSLKLIYDGQVFQGKLKKYGSCFALTNPKQTHDDWKKWELLNEFISDEIKFFDYISFLKIKDDKIWILVERKNSIDKVFHVLRRSLSFTLNISRDFQFIGDDHLNGYLFRRERGKNMHVTCVEPIFDQNDNFQGECFEF